MILFAYSYHINSSLVIAVFFLSNIRALFKDSIIGIPWRYCRFGSAAKSLQSCPTLCDPIDSSPPGSSVPGILQARALEWVAISFSNDPPPRVVEIKAKVNKWDLLILKNFCTTKETIRKVKRQPSEWEQIIANETTKKS